MLAYLAVFHFVRQQYVFMMAYRHLESEHSPQRGARGQVRHLHSHGLPPRVVAPDPLSRNFQWFAEGDFIQLLDWVLTGAVVFYMASLLFFAARQVQVFASGEP